MDKPVILRAIRYKPHNHGLNLSPGQRHPRLLHHHIHLLHHCHFTTKYLKSHILVIRNLVKIWFPLPAEDFVDLCTMTNISILIFNEYLHGYYIHGMHPLGQAEGSLVHIESTFEK